MQFQWSGPKWKVSAIGLVELQVCRLIKLNWILEIKLEFIKKCSFCFFEIDPALTKLKRPAGNYKHKHVHCIYFFGSHNYAWIPEDQLKPYLEFKEKFASSCKSATFKEAINKIETYIKNGTLEELKALENELSNDKVEEGLFNLIWIEYHLFKIYFFINSF